CSTPLSQLAGASVTLTDSAGTQHTTTSDASGNYSFSNIMLGSATIAASGTDSAGTNYSVTSSINVTGDQTANLNTTPTS
ncbi:MAG TPA: carboxypeptidase-like regulatory domain-containing protein, partial [Ktedonobacteraceae bacterium]|nr:carboxypeptidase-like regulatory domain-containing protein [Ktedonobacteraceae bacterium]